MFTANLELPVWTFVKKIYNPSLQNTLQTVRLLGRIKSKKRPTADRPNYVNETVRTSKELPMGWIDYKKVYDMVLDLWLKEAVELMW